jgi:hypothetical protein
MSQPRPGPLDEVARKWLALMERRLAWFVGVSETRRWQHYYTRAELLARLRDAERIRDQWAKLVLEPAKDIAPRPPN